MKSFYGYIRVSTVKQGEHGVSLQEQRAAIERYAKQNGFPIISWFEERQTAAKRGRPVFTQMLRELIKCKANGVIIHKIDRSARNLKDWADLGELIDRGMEVHFAVESLDLLSRGGRLSADIQAVVAADYIRNLREETRKGFYGRLKQGLYPLPAPVGYLDQGKGKPKEPDSITAPLIKKAFELYGTGAWNLDGLREELYQLGLRTKGGKRISRCGISTILNNPFYAGLIRIKRTQETFPGCHEPLITMTLFERVHAVLDGKTNTRAHKHSFLFRRLLSCKSCGYSLIGERQKGHVYYRCHTRHTPVTSIREEAVERYVTELFSSLQFSEKELVVLENLLSKLTSNWVQEHDTHIQALDLRLKALDDRIARLTDAYIDRLVEKDTFEERRVALLAERQSMQGKLAEYQADGHSVPDRMAKFLELTRNVHSSYISGLPAEKRDLLKTVTSNRSVDGKNVEIQLQHPFQLIANRRKNSHGAPYRYTPRTMQPLFNSLLDYFAADQAPENPAPF